MATTKRGGYTLNPDGDPQDAAGKSAPKQRVQGLSATISDIGARAGAIEAKQPVQRIVVAGEPQRYADDFEDDFDPSGEPSVAGLKTAELEAVAEFEETNLDGAKTNAERGARIETARLVRRVMSDRDALAGHTAEDLAAVASALDIEGRSDMNKDALVEALAAEIDASE